jgi:cytochrome c oxidase subunit 2
MLTINQKICDKFYNNLKVIDEQLYNNFNDNLTLVKYIFKILFFGENEFEYENKNISEYEYKNSNVFVPSKFVLNQTQTVLVDSSDLETVVYSFLLFIFINGCLCSISYSDSSENWQLNFQDPATPVMEGIINFHNDLMLILVSTVVFVLWMLYRCIYFFEKNKNPISQKFVHGTTIEIIWTCTPALILLFVAIPSFSLLYSMDEVIDPIMTLKVIGHQWYWSYEYSDVENGKDSIAFDSYMIQENDLEKGQFRLLEVDNRVVLPIKTHIRLLITAADVLHSWAVPSLGIKLDACPGRLNQTSIFIKREGVFYGQCSEICGINHGFMPIVVEAVSLNDYTNWLEIKNN